MNILQFLLNGNKIKSDMIYKYPNGRFVYQASPDSEEIPLTILDTSLSPDNPVYWTYTDKEGRRYTPKSLPSKEKTITKKWNPYSWGSIVPFEYSRNSYYRPEDALEAFNTITFGGANNFSPVQWGRRIFDIKDVLNGSMSGQQYWDRWINGNEGLVSGEYAREHPWATTAINGVADLATFLGGTALTKLPELRTALQAEELAAQDAVASAWEGIMGNGSKTLVAQDDSWTRFLPGKGDYSFTKWEPYSGYTATTQSPKYSEFAQDVAQGASWGRSRGSVLPTKANDFSLESMSSGRLGNGAEAVVVENPVNVGRVLKFNTDLSDLSKEGIMRRATRYANERNQLPFNMPLSIEGTYQRGGRYFPVFSQERVLPINEGNLQTYDSAIGTFNNSVNGGMYYPGSYRPNNILLENNFRTTTDFKPANLGVAKDGNIMGIDLGWDSFENLPQKNIKEIGDNIAKKWNRHVEEEITAKNASSKVPNIVRTIQDNGKIRLSLPSHTDNKPRQFVLEPAPEGNNKYYVHMRMWDDIENKVPASNVTNEEKQQLFDALYDELPEGAEILFPKSGPGNYGTRGTVVGLQRLSRDTRFTPGTKGTLLYLDKDGKTVRTYEGTSFIKTPRITEANAASITPKQWTAAQDAAIARGDMAEAQRLRDLHFKVSAPNTQIIDKQYHGSPYTFNIFDPAKRGNTDQGWFGKGYYFTPSYDYAHMYGEPRAFYINAEDVYTKGTGVMHFGRESGPRAKTWQRMMSKKGKAEAADDILDELRFSDAVRDAMPQTKPYDGIFEEVVTRNNNQMKLADAVTYDDKGVRIPLGKRDNFKSNDIRYSWLPWFLGGTSAAILYPSTGLNYYKDGGNLSKKNLQKAHGGKMNTLQLLKNGSGIHIKKENKGKFTDYCGGKVTSECISKGKHSSNPTIRKRATFAANARKWKHQQGGNLFRRGNGEYFYQASPDSKKIIVNPGMTGIMKSKLAIAAHFGNPTARRMTNYDGRSYTFPNEWDEVEPGIYEPLQGNVYVSSYGNLVTPQIQDNGKSLEFVEDVWSPENDPRSYAQSLKFNNAKDAQYFAEHYKEIAPMMNLYNVPKKRRGYAIKYLQGGFMNKVGNFLNSDYGKSIVNLGQLLYSGISDASNKIKQNEKLQKWKQFFVNSQSLSDDEIQNFYDQSIYNQQMNNPDGNPSPIVANHYAYELGQLKLQERKKEAEMLANLYITQMSLINNNLLTGGSGFNFAGMATDILSGVLGNSSKTQAVTNPSSTYSLFKMTPVDFSVKKLKL